MIKYENKKSDNIHRKALVFFNMLSIGVYKSTALGKHYGFVVGIGDKEIHIILRRWEDDLMFEEVYDA